MSVLTDMPLLQEKCIDRIEECLLKIEKRYNHMVRIPKIDFSLRGKRHGQLMPDGDQYIIQLNARLLYLNRQIFINKVPGYWAVQYFIAKYYGENVFTPHGEVWKKTIKSIGQNPVKDIRLKTGKYRIDRKVKYVCGCSGRVHLIGIRRHNNLRSSGELITCPVCNQLCLYADQ